MSLSFVCIDRRSHTQLSQKQSHVSNMPKMDLSYLPGSAKCVSMNCCKAILSKPPLASLCALLKAAATSIWEYSGLSCLSLTKSQHLSVHCMWSAVWMRKSLIQAGALYATESELKFPKGMRSWRGLTQDCPCCSAQTSARASPFPYEHVWGESTLMEPLHIVVLMCTSELPISSQSL